MAATPRAYVAGIFEHPQRVIDDKSLATVYLEILAGVLADSGLTIGDVDGFHRGEVGDAPLGLLHLLGDTATKADDLDFRLASALDERR